MDSKTALVLVGLGAAVSTTTTRAAELENKQVSKSAVQDAAYEIIAQHAPRELTYEEMDGVTAGQPSLPSLEKWSDIRISPYRVTFGELGRAFITRGPLGLLEKAALRGLPPSDLLGVLRQWARQFEATPITLPPPPGEATPTPTLTPTPSPTPTPPSSATPAPIPFYQLGGQPPAR